VNELSYNRCIAEDILDPTPWEESCVPILFRCPVCGKAIYEDENVACAEKPGTGIAAVFHAGCALFCTMSADALLTAMGIQMSFGRAAEAADGKMRKGDL